MNKAGGIVWCDFDDEFSPIDDLKQIVGHTSQWETGRAKQHNSEGYINITDANNICIDCHLNQYITIANGKIELKDYADL
jgi:ribose 5-phosphate isomerase